MLPVVASQRTSHPTTTISPSCRRLPAPESLRVEVDVDANDGDILAPVPVGR